MNAFGAKVDIKVSSSKDIQYCLVLCHNNISQEALGKIAAFVNQNSHQLVFKSADQRMWVVALKAADSDRLRQFRGIKLVGGININAAKLLKTLQPVVKEK